MGGLVVVVVGVVVVPQLYIFLTTLASESLNWGGKIMGDKLWCYEVRSHLARLTSNSSNGLCSMYLSLIPDDVVHAAVLWLNGDTPVTAESRFTIMHDGIIIVFFLACVDLIVGVFVEVVSHRWVDVILIYCHEGIAIGTTLFVMKTWTKNRFRDIASVLWRHLCDSCSWYTVRSILPIACPSSWRMTLFTRHPGARVTGWGPRLIMPT